MKKGEKYRYTLQFGTDSEANIRAGELLEKMGNKKSAVIVAALNAYLEQHPELYADSLKIRIEEETSISRKKLEDIIRAIVQEQFGRDSPRFYEVTAQDGPQEALQDDIAQMISNLQLFT